ncbi:DUF3967 domain-containing protein [Thalassobacillus sp. C254]|uniref:DUF3967 domain-containing protein n=1 Tax=Thalassobacillus sp. C254 TaxID=1225341 RepID=UPI0006CFAB77|nr:DUF3967 domain-containing protein [Thalassobacillus sp. C254]
MKEWFSVAEVVDELGIPANTIRRYINNHGIYLKIKKKHKSYFIHKESLNVIKDIRRWYQDGKSGEQVDELLSNQGIPMTISMGEDEQTDIKVTKVLSELKEDMKEQKEFNKRLIEELEKRDQYINEKLKTRDERLLSTMKEMMEVKKQIAAKEERKSWWKFWR